MSIRNFFKDDTRFILFNEIYLKYSGVNRKQKAMLIIEHTINCISEKGFNNITIAMISRESSVSRATIKEYFENITDLRNFSIKYIRVLYQSYVIEELSKKKDFKDILNSYILACFRWPKAFPKYTSVWVSYLHLANINKKYRKLNTEAVTTGLARLTDILRIGVASGDLKSSSVQNSAFLIHTFITGLLLSMATEDQKEIDEYVNITRNYVSHVLDINI